MTAAAEVPAGTRDRRVLLCAPTGRDARLVGHILAEADIPFMACANARELAEEIGKGARTWQHLTSFYTSPGFTDEECHLFMATDLYDESAETEENERIEIVEWPLAKLDNAIRDSRDAKTLIGLLWLRAFLCSTKG